MTLPASVVVTKAIRSSRNTVNPPKNKQEPLERGIYMVPSTETDLCVIELVELRRDYDFLTNTDQRDYISRKILINNIFPLYSYKE